MLTILMGRAKTGKSEQVLRRIGELGDSSRQILLVPEHASHQAEVDLCRACGDTASRHAEVLSFRRLCDRVLTITGGAAQVTLDAGGKLLTLQKALGEVAPLLKVYRRPSQKASFLQQMLDLFDEQGVDVCYEIHPGEDLHDGVTFERFLALVDNHPRCNMLYDPSHLHLQQMDYLAYIDIYHARIKAFHVKDAEFRRNGRNGVYGGYQPWQQRAGRFRSPGDGQIDFKGVFSKLTEYDFAGWAVLEWECCLKDSETGAREGSEFIRRHIIPVAGRAFDDFAAGGRE